MTTPGTAGHLNHHDHTTCRGKPCK